MKGATAVVAMVLMFLLVISASTIFFSYFRGLQTDAEASGEKQMVELDIPPKLLNLICYTGYGYMELSLSQGQKTAAGQVLYSVDLDTGKRVIEGFADMNISGTGKIHIPYNFDKDERYLVTLSGNKWKIAEYCRPFDDSHLIFYLPFSSGEGTSAEDDSDYDSSYSIINSSYTTGYFGDALKFDGNSSYIWLGSDSKLNPEQFTLAMWFKTTSNQTNLRLYRWRLHGVNLGLNWDENNTGRVRLEILDNNTIIYTTNSSTGYDDDAWHFVAGTYNKSYLGLYLDGSFVDLNQTAIDVYYNSGGASIGRDGDYDAGYFNGTLDEVRLYERALSESELDTLYLAYQNGE